MPRYPRGDVRYVSTIDEQIEDLKKVTLDDVRQFYKQFYGAGEGEIVISGQFDPDADAQARHRTLRRLEERQPLRARPRPLRQASTPSTTRSKRPTSRTRSSSFGMPMKMNDEDPDYPALTIAGMVFGGTPNSRLFQRIRVKDGLSYGAGAQFSASPPKTMRQCSPGTPSPRRRTCPKSKPTSTTNWPARSKTASPPTRSRRPRRPGSTNAPCSAPKRAPSPASCISRERWGRTLEWDAKLEAAVAALTPQQVNDAFKRHVDPAAITIVKGGDFKKAAPTNSVL